MHTAAETAPLLAGGTLRFERTVIAVFGVCPVAQLLLGGVRRKKGQFFACGTDIDIARRFIPEAIRTKKLGAVINIRQWNLGADVLILDSDNVLFRAIFSIHCHLTTPEVPA